MKWIWIILIIVIVVFGFDYLTGDKQIENQNTYNSYSINGVSIDIEVADTDNERIQGLSGREGLGENEGLLFIFEEEGNHGIWMKDMNFAIDIAWFNKDKKIIYIEKNVTPESYPKVFYPPSLSLYVLETNSGFFESRQITIGDVLETKED